MRRVFQILFLLYITCLGNVFSACAQNHDKSYSDGVSFVGQISFGRAEMAFLLDAYGDTDSDVTFLGYSVVETKSRFNDSQLRSVLLKGLTPEVQRKDVVSFSSFMPDVAVVFEGKGQEVNVLFDFSHNLLQLNSIKGDILFDFSAARGEYLNAVIQLFPDDVFLKQYASR